MRPHAAAALLLATAHGGALPALSLPLMPQAMLDVRRNANYLARAGYVFTAYKAFQLKTKVSRKRLKADRATVDGWWEKQHEWGGKQMYGLFYYTSVEVQMKIEKWFLMTNLLVTIPV